MMASVCRRHCARIKFLDRDGLWRQYTEADLRYDLARGYLAIDVHAAAREGEGKDTSPNRKRAGVGKKDGGARVRRRACIAVASEGEASSIALRDLKWSE